MLDIFSTDPLEKQFSKLRQGSGGTYFITVQQIFKKVNISKSKLLLNLNSDAVNDLFEIEPGHHCKKCSFTLTKQMCDYWIVFRKCKPLFQKIQYLHLYTKLDILLLKAKIKI